MQAIFVASLKFHKLKVPPLPLLKHIASIPKTRILAAPLRCYSVNADKDSSQSIPKLEIALQLANSGDLEGAAQILVDEIVRAKTSNSDAALIGKLFNNLGVLYENMNKLDMATKSYMEAMAATPTDPAVYSNLGVIFQRANRTEPAISMYKKALELAPTHSMTKYRLAKLYMANDDMVHEARRLLTECMQQEPDFLQPQADLAVLLCQRVSEEDRELSLKIIGEMEKRAPGESIVTHTGAFVLCKLGKTTEAMAMLELAKTQFPNDAQVYLNSALLLEQQQQAKLALIDAEKAFELDNTSPNILFVLARLLDANNRTEESEHLYQEMIKAQPTNVMFYVGLMNVWVERGRFSDALKLLEDASTQYPSIKSELEMYLQYVKARQMGR